MNDIPSILTSIKKLLGLEEDNIQFDPDITIHINTAFMVLNQLGLGPETGFFITDKTQVWAELVADRKDIEAVKSYVYLKVKMIFDPPTMSFVLDAMKRSIDEMESRLLYQIEYVAPVETTDPAGTTTTTTTTVTTTVTTTTKPVV